MHHPLKMRVPIEALFYAVEDTVSDLASPSENEGPY